ncbi:FliO/MopB family protein [Roseateles toxinivorans]|uniref:Flagellar protein FliO/FliZ n=1 Tax=Roseateles toxinivorans TaxID=270368 RepID=A0A4R6QPN8_9BURK|nr:flagellar biosynthetic protein FliO [Roseateles toxinivorans]TDP71608.1 flagellar protein FliO/FliZ [Roseateles toxinivorans]
MGTSLYPILWFIAIIAMIPLALWLLKRTPMGGAASGGLMRTVAVLPLSPNQRLLTVEVGQGEERRWLVLGVTSQQITTLHTMAPQGDVPAGLVGLQAAPFAQLLSRFRSGGGSGGATSGDPGAH